MTDTERDALCKYLVEQRRHYLALAANCAKMLEAIAPAPEKVYNTSNGGKNVSVTLPVEFREIK